MEMSDNGIITQSPDSVKSLFQTPCEDSPSFPIWAQGLSTPRLPFGLNLVHNQGHCCWHSSVTNEEAYKWLQAVANNIGSSLCSDVTLIAVEDEFNGQYRFEFSPKAEAEEEKGFYWSNYGVATSARSPEVAANILGNYHLTLVHFSQDEGKTCVVIEMVPISLRVASQSSCEENRQPRLTLLTAAELCEQLAKKYPLNDYDAPNHYYRTTSTFASLEEAHDRFDEALASKGFVEGVVYLPQRGLPNLDIYHVSFYSFQTPGEDSLDQTVHSNLTLGGYPFLNNSSKLFRYNESPSQTSESQTPESQTPCEDWSQSSTLALGCGGCALFFLETKIVDGLCEECRILTPDALTPDALTPDAPQALFQDQERYQDFSLGTLSRMFQAPCEDYGINEFSSPITPAKFPPQASPLAKELALFRKTPEGFRMKANRIVGRFDTLKEAVDHFTSHVSQEGFIEGAVYYPNSKYEVLNQYHSVVYTHQVLSPMQGLMGVPVGSYPHLFQAPGEDSVQSTLYRYHDGITHTIYPQYESTESGPMLRCTLCNVGEAVVDTICDECLTPDTPDTPATPATPAITTASALVERGPRKSSIGHRMVGYPVSEAFNNHMSAYERFDELQRHNSFIEGAMFRGRYETQCQVITYHDRPMIGLRTAVVGAYPNLTGNCDLYLFQLQFQTPGEDSFQVERQDKKRTVLEGAHDDEYWVTQAPLKEAPASLDNAYCRECTTIFFEKEIIDGFCEDCRVLTPDKAPRHTYNLKSIEKTAPSPRHISKIKMRQVLNLSGLSTEQVQSIYGLPVSITSINLSHAGKSEIEARLINLPVEKYKDVILPESNMATFWITRELIANSKRFQIPQPVYIAVKGENDSKKTTMSSTLKFSELCALLSDNQLRTAYSESVTNFNALYHDDTDDQLVAEAGRSSWMIWKQMEGRPGLEEYHRYVGRNHAQPLNCVR